MDKNASEPNKHAVRLIIEYIVNSKSIDREKLFNAWPIIESNIDQLKQTHKNNLMEYSRNMLCAFNQEISEVHELTNSFI